jgi:hypothetical protein
MLCRHLVLSGSIVLSLVTGAVAQTDVSECGQTVTGAARLVADLNCVAAVGSSAVVITRGTLDLNGHTISGDGVGCDGKCEVLGPGSITNANFEFDAAVSSNKKIAVRNVTITSSYFGVASNQKVLLVDSAITDSNNGVQAPKVGIVGSTLSGNGNSVRGHRVSIESSAITGNATGVRSYRKLDATLSTITGNGEFDIETSVKPRLEETTCEVSEKWNTPEESWGVCTLD